MRKKIVLLAFVSALLLLATFGTQIIVSVRAETLDVNPGDSIQEAINLAQNGDTIFVHNGTYYEHVVVNKTVWLKGENRETTIIDGGGTEIVVLVNADNVNVTGFTIQNGGEFENYGISLYGSTGTTISNNTIRDNDWNGLGLINESNNNNIVGNFIIDNHNQAGIHIRDSGNNIIYNNTIRNNLIGTWISSSTSPNTFYHNNFINNTEQVLNFGIGTIFDDGYPSGGNFWSDYTGVDEKRGPNQDVPGSDGIGDIPYPDEVAKWDNYPLMSPWGDIGDTEYPVADAGPDQLVFQNMTVAFDGSGSYDDIGIRSYVWNFIDVTPKILTGVRPTYKFKNVGNFDVMLNVTDYTGKWATDRMWVNVSLDNIKPSITNVSHEPDPPDDGEIVTVTVVVTDDESGVYNVTLSYRTDGGENWTNVPMEKMVGSTYQAEIPGLPSGTNVTYWIIAYDNSGNFEVDDNYGEYYPYTVVPEFSAVIFLSFFTIFTLVVVALRKMKKGTS